MNQTEPTAPILKVSGLRTYFFTGEGVTCLKGFEDDTTQLRFKVIAKWADSLEVLPAEFADRKIAEYPELPGRGEHEVLGSFDLHIVKD